MPDIEKRLEAFVRFAHGIIIFPGGVGTAEEILYILGILLDPANAEMKYPVIMTGPESSKDYFNQLDEFLVTIFGEKIRDLYTIILGDPIKVARHMNEAVQKVKETRRKYNDAYYFNWQLKIDKEFQLPFETSHENIKQLPIDRSIGPHLLAVNLRRVFSGVVAGNVREEGIRNIEKNGPYEIQGESDIMMQLDKLLSSFVTQGRMKINGGGYQPCYRVIQ
jgi:hypothetical protein